MRPSDRKNNEMRSISFETGVSKHAEGSCLVKFGDTHVLCTASVENRVPPWLRNSGSGWVTAEYGMLPRSTGERMRREASVGKQSGRTQEIQRLIGRSLRSVIDLDQLGENQISIDCDVIQADGGTRTASISGAFIALKQSVNFLLTSKEIKKDPIKEYLGAVSCGIYRGKPILDLDYKFDFSEFSKVVEDSAAEADANFVITDKNKIIEIQATAEQYPFSEKMFLELMMLAKSGIEEIIKKQKDVLEN
jgi:ribonuclease PH